MFSVVQRTRQDLTGGQAGRGLRP